jgi:exodeoxyribonuclease V alpha subunit
MLARLRAQQQPSPVIPGNTVKEDIEDALREVEPRIAKTPAQSALERLRNKLKGTSNEPSSSKVSGSNQPPSAIKQTIPEPENIPAEDATTDRNGLSIVYNTKQQRAVDLGGSGKSVVIIGAAGTGKTTCQKGLVQKLIHNDILPVLEAGTHKHLVTGTPGIVICAYTRRAVANIRRNMPADLQNNCITIHKLLEYSPDYIDYIDEEGNEKTKMVFAPMRNAMNPLPASIHTIIYEEGSMLGTDLYDEVQDALGHPVQEIFLGDIQQLPPVFGPAILGFKLLELPVIELTEVYRQALESPILRLAHRVLSGRGIPKSEFAEWSKDEEKLKIKPWLKSLHWEHALPAICTFLTMAIDAGAYDPDEDIVLCPFNKSFGTDEINKKIANHLARKRGAATYEIIAGYNKLYLSPGDKVLFDKEDATVLEITFNPAYSGKKPTPASVDLDYWGCVSGSANGFNLDAEDPDMDMEEVLKAMQTAGADGDNETRKKKCSHVIKLQMNDSEQIVDVDTVGDVNLIGLGYALTIHKSQGSEWKRVFFITHGSHATMLQRELLYTGITRAKESLLIVCEADALEKGIRSQRVKGETIEEKAEFFKGKVKERINKN